MKNFEMLIIYSMIITFKINKLTIYFKTKNKNKMNKDSNLYVKFIINKTNSEILENFLEEDDKKTIYVIVSKTYLEQNEDLPDSIYQEIFKIRLYRKLKFKTNKKNTKDDIFGFSYNDDEYKYHHVYIVTRKNSKADELLKTTNYDTIIKLSFYNVEYICINLIVGTFRMLFVVRNLDNDDLFKKKILLNDSVDYVLNKNDIQMIINGIYIKLVAKFDKVFPSFIGFYSVCPSSKKRITYGDLITNFNVDTGESFKMEIIGKDNADLTDKIDKDILLYVNLNSLINFTFEDMESEILSETVSEYIFSINK